MKVFLSWSGSQSHKIALVFRDWLPSVIQEIVPYVSSEDIDKGARWSTDIAKELSDSKFGILCVTRDNINAPWLTFEAGALSKTMDKSFVSPFLFDIKRSEVDGPVLQFQSTVFEKEDLKKLVITLNKACDKNRLKDEQLNKTFEVWYSSLEEALEKLRDADHSEQDAEGTTELQTPKTQEVLEEILELSRINQKLIRNPDGALESNLKEMSKLLHMLLERIERLDDPRSMRQIRELHPIMLDELIHMFLSENSDYLGAKTALSLIKNQFPWIYDAGIETINILQSSRTIEEKRNTLDRFRRIMDFSIDHPIMREMLSDRETYLLYRRFQEMLVDTLERNLVFHVI